MRETFPEKRPGDRLEASHVNALSAVARRLSGANGGYGSGVGGSFTGRAGLPPFVQALVRVTEDLGSSRYKVRTRYYESDTDSWATSTEEYTMDASEVSAVFNVNDVTVAFYHEQSGFFIPLGVAASLVLRVGKSNGPIPVDSENGVVRIWENGEETETDVEGVHHDWITNNEAIPDDTEVIIGWFSNEGVWRVIGAACT